MLLKRKVKKLIDDEDPRKPLTDDQIASMLEAQGIDVTRRTVAKYREDLRIPSTHQRRIRDRRFTFTTRCIAGTASNATFRRRRSHLAKASSSTP